MSAAAIQPRPVFIIGAARSGTKYLRDLAASSSTVNSIPFDVNFLWRLGSESTPHDELNASNLNKAQIQRVRRAIVRGASLEPGNVLLEKTVSNALRVDFIRAVFPEAKFVHLIRDGRSVIESVRRVWDIPTTLHYKLKKLKYYPWTNGRYALRILTDNMPGARKAKRVWGVRYQGIEADLESMTRLQICAKQWTRCIELATEQLSHVAREDVLQIRYEDMLHDPAVFESYCDFLDIPAQDSVRAAHQSRTRTDTVDKWRGCFSDQDVIDVAGIINPLQQKLGYGLLATGDSQASTSHSNNSTTEPTDTRNLS